MREPTTALDARFSEAGTSPVGWAETLRAVEAAPTFWISTTRSDGRPHVSPVVAVWLEDALHFSTGPTEQKAHNLQASSSVALTTGSSDWRSGLDVVVEGTAERVTDAALLERLAGAWRQKWDGRWEFVVGDGGFDNGEHGMAHVYAVRPTRVLAFGKNPFTHTSHRFAAD